MQSSQSVQLQWNGQALSGSAAGELGDGGGVCVGTFVAVGIAFYGLCLSAIIVAHLLNVSFCCGSNLNFSGSQGKRVANGRPVVAALVSEVCPK